MAFAPDGFIHPNEAQALLALAANQAHVDYLMSIDNKGKKILGESRRLFADAKEMMDVSAFIYASRRGMSGTSASGILQLAPLTVIRPVDVATASIASLINNQERNLTVSLLSFKASGDSSNELQPFFQLELREARVVSHTIVCGGQPNRPHEIITFSYRQVEMGSAEQDTQGLRGALRLAKLMSAA